MIKKLIKYLYHLYLIKTKPAKYARVSGVDVGDGTRFKGIKLGAFSTEPYLIKIGKNCLITAEVQFLTHDGSIYHLKEKYPMVDYIDKIVVGDNVFIGLRAIILPGVNIGSNVVIGAGSVVTRDIPSNTMAAGVPAKVICTLEEYLNKKETSIIHTGGLNYQEKKKILTSKFINKN